MAKLGKFVVVVVVIGVILEVAHRWIGAPANVASAPASAPAPKRATPSPSAASAKRTLTPAWPKVEGQGAAVAEDLYAKNYYVVLDASGSMNNTGCSGSQTKMVAAKAALATFAQSVPAQANLGLLVFDGQGINEKLALAPDNRAAFTAAVGKVRANGGTPLLSSISQAYARLKAQGARQLGYGEYHLVIVTDGMPDTGQDPTSIVNTMLAESPVVVQTIGFCIGANHVLNQAGRTIYKAADDPSALSQGLAEVLAEAPQFTVTDFKK